MQHPNYNINKLEPGNAVPFQLLLLADETVAAIEKYIYASEVYTVTIGESPKLLAVAALYKLSDVEIEIKNIAVAENWQGKGVGSYLVNAIKQIAKAGNYQTLIVGTPDCEQQQIHFYEKNGFVKYGVRKNFFIENYPAPIIQDGVTLRDMVLLKTGL